MLPIIKKKKNFLKEEYTSKKNPRVNYIILLYLKIDAVKFVTSIIYQLKNW